MSPIFLTYNNRAHTDGAGAQLYRIYGIYCLARQFGFGYLHSPLWRLDNQGLQALRTQSFTDTLADQFNALCAIPSDAAWPADAEVIDLPDPQPGFETALKAQARDRAAPLVVRITHPHPVLDSNTHLWRAVSDVAPFAGPAYRWDGKRPLRVAVHIRRGDIHVLERNRLIPNSYYIGVIHQLRRALQKAGLPHLIEVHSERAQKFTVGKSDRGTYNLTEDFQFEPEDDAFDEIENIKGLRLRFDEPAVESFARIATADIIVTSISCFSYVGAVLNPHAQVIYHPFFHAPLPGWLVATPDGAFETQNLVDAFPQRRSTLRSVIQSLRVAMGRQA
ncbi:hypothetical protein [Rhizobium sp. CC-YZS058]|uniref:hypothetical protein n=1 Tax=Rhizobium sp. CC-YZS058 TaxID=3042153 RepID=UPI002B05639D|nr:hypothetical protein [Rhizobium sp. CC-YZS058]MEA3535636.1 hypothetical protein [Rhizobium sp. CC-YZS058]